MSNKLMKKLTLIILFNFVIHFFVNAEELPQNDENIHLGVASCASSTCHGSIIPRSSSRVLQNEYITWSRKDAHAQAYKTLLTEESKKIANKLGLKSAQTAKICLDCHSDNVASNMRGERFQIDDGIGCESCHGGAEHYIKSHTNRKVERLVNINNGLYPSDNPVKRSRLCLSCHLGNKDKFASHDIMGAGHPRLAFELDTFGLLQPLHFKVDDDYKKYKWSGDSYITWVYGQLGASLETIKLIKNKIVEQNTLFPEIALFDCHSCHHEMSDLKWTKEKGQGFKPGTIRLNDGNFKMLLAIAATTSFNDKFHKNIKAIVDSLNDKNQLVKVLDVFSEDINTLQVYIEEQSVAQRKKTTQQVLYQILKMGKKGEFSDYISAEQTVMAIDLLINALDKRPTFDTEINKLFSLVDNENSFNAQDFILALNDISKRF
jgi:hypothetical protein